MIYILLFSIGSIEKAKGVSLVGGRCRILRIAIPIPSPILSKVLLSGQQNSILDPEWPWPTSVSLQMESKKGTRGIMRLTSKTQRSHKHIHISAERVDMGMYNV